MRSLISMRERLSGDTTNVFSGNFAYSLGRVHEIRGHNERFSAIASIRLPCTRDFAATCPALLLGRTCMFLENNMLDSQCSERRAIYIHLSQKRLGNAPQSTVPPSCLQPRHALLCAFPYGT